MEKLSNKGWANHKRVVALDEHSLCYYRKVPKTFTTDSLESMGKDKPK